MKRRRITDRRYLRWIKSQGCLVAGKVDECQGPIDPDHTTPKSLGGSDYTAVPLCRKIQSVCLPSGIGIKVTGTNGT
jgi:hypothetical protein